MMNDGQLAFMYAFILMLAVVMYAALEAVLSERVVKANHADKLCQEIYGPQTGAYWEGNTLMCQTVRGEILPLREPK